MMLLGFALMVAWMPGSHDPGLPIRWALLAGISAWLFASGQELRKDFPAWLVGGFLGWAALTGLWAPSTSQWVFELAHWAILGAVFLAAAPWKDDLLDGMLVGLWVNVGLAVAQRLGFDFVPQATVPGGLFVGANIFGEVAALLFAAELVRGRFSRVALGGAVLSGEREAILAVLAALAVWSWAERRWLTWGVVGIMPVLAGLSWVLNYHPGSASLRATQWTEAVGQLTWLGHGLGSYLADHPWVGYLHSDGLLLAYEGGIVGVILALALLAFLFRAAPSSWPLLAALLIEVSVGFPLEFPATAAVVVLVASDLGLRRYRICDLAPIRRDELFPWNARGPGRAGAREDRIPVEHGVSRNEILS